MKYLLMVVLLFSFGQARAGQTLNFETGNGLLELCEAYLGDNTAVNIAKGNTCGGYIAGLVDVHKTFVDWKVMEQRWCLPGDMRVSQLVRVVTKHLQEQPQDLHLSASGLVANAFILAFPCE